jgi:hypothetical protein
MEQGGYPIARMVDRMLPPINMGRYERDVHTPRRRSPDAGSLNVPGHGSRHMTRPTPVDFTDKERRQIVTELMALKKPYISRILRNSGLASRGTKAEMRATIEAALEGRSLTYSRLVEFLDEVCPWGKQHVVLYEGPRNPILDWRNPEWLVAHLKKCQIDTCLNATLPLVLPEEMQVSSIVYDGRRLRVTAIKRRDWKERAPEYDETKAAQNGDHIELHAFIRRVQRGFVAFEWDLGANTAFLQVSQLPSGIKYEQVEEEFTELVSGWLDMSRFSKLDLAHAIKQLHSLEAAGNGETRSHGINYRSLRGRRLEARSATPTDPLLGEPPIDEALSTIRDCGVGHLGNFYWLSNGRAGTLKNPLESDVHVILVGSRNRLNLPTPNDEPTIRYVLSRVRSHCSAASGSGSSSSAA